MLLLMYVFSVNVDAALCTNKNDGMLSPEACHNQLVLDAINTLPHLERVQNIL
jgi:hypothetical protein